MNGACRAAIRRTVAWWDPLSVAAGLETQDGCVALISDGGTQGRWSYVAAAPDRVHVGALDGFDRLRLPEWGRGVVGLASYDAGARWATDERERVWPDLMLARYPAMLAFDHHAGTVELRGSGEDPAAARRAIDQAAAWLDRAVDPSDTPPPAADFQAEERATAYVDAVCDVIARIGAGDLFQANIARAWRGRLHAEADPFDVFLRLRARASAYGAFWRLGDLAVVSNSPEMFVTFDPDSGRIETRPIKGTRPRAGGLQDGLLAEELAASAKDRAENLMIVDLMRNDLSRVAEPGSVRVERLFEIESHPTVHHLVSTVSGRIAAAAGPADLLDAAFPPGSITGAPKHQAMRVIARHEPPRGPWCGSLFHVDEEGRLTASVLIRTAAFRRDAQGWGFRTQAGAGIVADSVPEAELAETEVKISALREALIGS